MHKVRGHKILVTRGSRYINVTLLAIPVSKYQTGSSAASLPLLLYAHLHLYYKQTSSVLLNFVLIVLYRTRFKMEF